MNLDQFIWWCGVAALAAVALWLLAILVGMVYRLVELVDFTRWQRALFPQATAWQLAKFMGRRLVEMVILGRTWDSISIGVHSWHGIGKWRRRSAEG